MGLFFGWGLRLNPPSPTSYAKATEVKEGYGGARRRSERKGWELKKKLIVKLDLSRVRVVDRSRYRVTIIIFGDWRSFDWPCSDIGVSDQTWSDISDWANVAIGKLLRGRRFTKVLIKKTNGRRGEAVTISWLEMATGILMPILYERHIRRNKQGKPLVADPIKVKPEPVPILA